MYYRVMHLKDADQMANSVDAGQTAPGYDITVKPGSIEIITW